MKWKFVTCFIATVERSLLEEEQEEDEEEKRAPKPEDDKEDQSNDEEEYEGSFQCSKYRKLYHTMGWLKGHELSCSGTKGKAKKTQVLSDPIKREPARFLQA